MSLIDEEKLVSNARKVGKRSSARAHFSRQYTHQWYTEERAIKFDDRMSAMCRYCEQGEAEMILHSLQYSSRKEVHTEHSKHLDDKYGRSKCQITYYHS